MGDDSLELPDSSVTDRLWHESCIEYAAEDPDDESDIRNDSDINPSE